MRAAALVSTALAFVLGSPLRGDSSAPRTAAAVLKADPYETFVDHCTDTFLYSRLSTLYPNTTTTLTQERNFDLARFAAGSLDSLQIREIEDIQSIKRVVFHPAARRRDGNGNVVEATVFAGYEVAWGNHEFKAIVASWPEGYQTITQWHIIGQNPQAAQALVKACVAFCSAFHDAILVFDQSIWRPDYELWRAVQQSSWDDVILDEDLKKRVQHDYRSFFKAESVYKNLAVPWKRGLIFLGPPGNGKTVSIKAIMRDVKVPILYVKTFHSIRQIFTRARAEAPCVLIMEDLDSLITDQNRSFFLNEVDGLEDNDGLLLLPDQPPQIGTTNHFDRLDPALSNRPSRFDRKYDFPNPNRAERRQYAVYWQNKLSSNHDIDFPDKLLDEVADKTDKFSFAYMKEAFVSALLTLAGQEDGSEVLSFRKVLLDQITSLREGLGEKYHLGIAASRARKSVHHGKGETCVRFDYPESGAAERWKMAMSSPLEVG